MAWNKVGARLLAVYAGGAGQCQPALPRALATSNGASDEGVTPPAVRADFAVLRKRTGTPAAQYRARVLLTMG